MKDWNIVRHFGQAIATSASDARVTAEGPDGIVSALLAVAADAARLTGVDMKLMFACHAPNVYANEAEAIDAVRRAFSVKRVVGRREQN